jgi:antitoxin HicB
MLLMEKKGGDLQQKTANWNQYSKIVYECRVYICPDETGGFYAYIANLPGVVSEGDTIEEAIENVREAFAGVVASYRDSGEPIPWTLEVEPIPEKATEKRIVMDA